MLSPELMKRIGQRLMSDDVKEGLTAFILEMQGMALMYLGCILCYSFGFE